VINHLKVRAIALLNKGIDKLQKTFPPNRVVIILTPFFVPLAAAASAWVANNFPGISLSEGTIIGFAGAGALAAIGGAYKWLDRWQQQERVKGTVSVPIRIDADQLTEAIDKVLEARAGSAATRS
jgi:hypothetical protein